MNNRGDYSSLSLWRPLTDGWARVMARQHHSELRNQNFRSLWSSQGAISESRQNCFVWFRIWESQTLSVSHRFMESWTVWNFELRNSSVESNYFVSKFRQTIWSVWSSKLAGTYTIFKLHSLAKETESLARILWKVFIETRFSDGNCWKTNFGQVCRPTRAILFQVFQTLKFKVLYGLDFNFWRAHLKATGILSFALQNLQNTLGDQKMSTRFY